MVHFIINVFRSTIYKIRHKIFSYKISYVGKNSKFIFPLKIEGKDKVRIGNNVAIGTYVHMWGGGGIYIGNDVLIAAHCCISSLNHNYQNSLIRNGGMIKKSVYIEDDVWLGYGVIVLPGVRIGQGSVIGAGSVVTNDIPPYSIAVGNPAKVIKQRELKDLTIGK